MKFQNPEFSKSIPIFANYKEIQAIYLFGSVAKGNQNLESDIDFGLLAETNCKEHLSLDLIKIGFHNFSLVYLPEANLTLQFEIVHLNNIIYKSDDFDKSTYYSRIVRMYNDFYYYREIQRKYLKERLLNGK